MEPLTGHPDALINKLAESVKNAISQGNVSKMNNCLTRLKFDKICIFPYPESSNNSEQEVCNFVEFLNQLFTTVATIKAMKYLLEEHKIDENAPVKLCLGTTKGRDLTITVDGSEKIIAEIFAVTDPKSNHKLKDEIISLAEDKSDVKRYAFFILAGDAFKKLNEKNMTKRYCYQSWTQYKKMITVEESKKAKIVNDAAIWSCKCNGKTIDIVCWPSTCCLKDF